MSPLQVQKEKNDNESIIVTYPMNYAEITGLSCRGVAEV